MAMPTDCIYKGEQHEHAYAQPWTESERTCDVSVQHLGKGALLFKDCCLKWIAVLENIVVFSKLKELRNRIPSILQLYRCVSAHSVG